MQESVGQLGNKDQMFVKSLLETVHKHLDDGNFDVDMFCKEVNISRTLMHMKLKKITGLSTTEFIRNIRLAEAEKMLAKGHLTVSEIAYRVEGVPEVPLDYCGAATQGATGYALQQDLYN